MLTEKQRWEYSITTWGVLISGFLTYGLIGVINQDVPSALKLGLLGGFGFSMVLSAVIQAARFFVNKSTQFKIIAAFLWPVTLFCIFFWGVISFIPYQIYNFVQMNRFKIKNGWNF